MTLGQVVKLTAVIALAFALRVLPDFKKGKR